MMVLLIIRVEFSEAGRGTPGMCPLLLKFCHFVCHNIGYKYIGKFLSQVMPLLAIYKKKTKECSMIVVILKNSKH